MADAFTSCLPSGQTEGSRSSTLPEWVIAPPPDGPAPAPSLRELAAGTTFGVYRARCSFCASRCGYCDFNTYTAIELGGGGRSKAYPATVLDEITLAAGATAGRGPGVARSSSVGHSDLLRPVRARLEFSRAWTGHLGLPRAPRVTTEANPSQ